MAAVKFRNASVAPAAASAVAIALCAGILIWVMELWKASLRLPLASQWGDFSLHAMSVKTMAQSGWYYRNPYLGMPFGAELYDYPFPDNLSWSIMKLISLFTPSYGSIMNIYFILTFFLAAVVCLFVLRKFGASYGAAIVAGELFAFLPCHFFRGEHHLFLSAYYLVPLVVMISLWIWAGELQPNSRRMAWVLAICILVGSWTAYYVFFGCFLLCAAGVAASARARAWRHLGIALSLSATVALVFGLNDLPNIVYFWQHGPNHLPFIRWPQESEVYGLKVAQMLLPVTGHRLPYLARLKASYNADFPLVNENDMASLGVVAAVGFLFLLGRILGRGQGGGRELFQGLAVLNLSALLLATLGGFGSLFNLLVTPQMRCYNRISIYIAFLSLFAVASLLDQLGQRLCQHRGGIWIWRGLLVTTLFLGVLDQTTAEFVPPYEHLRAEELNDAEFVKAIEAEVPRGAMIFQLPILRFPQLDTVNRLRVYELFKGYLHSDSLKWSYGAMVGRPEARWSAQFQGQPSERWVETLAFAGFKGIYIDRYGFQDNGAVLESRLRQLLGNEPTVSRDNRLAFFNLTNFAESLRAKYTPEEWQARETAALWIGGRTSPNPWTDR